MFKLKFRMSPSRITFHCLCVELLKVASKSKSHVAVSNPSMGILFLFCSQILVPKLWLFSIYLYACMYR